MAPKVEPTELIELDVEKMSGVTDPASGEHWLLLKSAAASGDDSLECSTCKGKGTIMEGNRKCPDCSGSGKVAKAVAAGETDEHLALAKAKLSTAELNDLDDSAFAYIEPGGEKDEGGKTTPRSKRHFAIHDKAHADNAAARIAQGAEFGDKASAKVKAAQKRFATKAAKGAVQDALQGTAAPELAGRDETYSRSGVRGPVTTGAQQLPEPRTAAGGRSTYTIPAEAGMDLTKAGAPLAFAVSSIADALEKMAEIRDLAARATKAGMTLTPPTPEESEMPGSMPWESYDSATLAQVAHALASCDGALTTIIARERVESSGADGSDITNAWDLEDAQGALDCALGIVARLSFTEAREADMAGAIEKAGRRLSGKTETALRSARDHLTSVIGDGADDDKAGDGKTSEKEDTISMELTKSELAEAIVAGVREVLKEAANNGGDLAEGDLHASGTIGPDLNVPGAGATKPGVTKAAGEPAQQDPQVDVSKQLKELTDYVGQLGGLVVKMARAPRGGGPILTGQLPAGLTAAAEGRQGEAVTKSAEDGEIERLEKQLDETSDPMRAQHLSMVLTQRKLERFHNAAGV